MKRFALLLALGALVLFPTQAFADSREWTSDPPKHPDSAYVWCTARGLRLTATSTRSRTTWIRSTIPAGKRTPTACSAMTWNATFDLLAA